MSAIQDPVRFGNFDPVPPKHCTCGARGEWPGPLCPVCVDHIADNTPPPEAS